MNLKPELFGQYADNVRRYYKFMRDNDIFAAHAIVSPQAARGPRQTHVGEADLHDA